MIRSAARPFFSTIACFVIATAGLLAAKPESPVLRIAFEKKRAVLEGRIGSREGADALIATLASARPDLRADSSRLEVTPGAGLPDFQEWRGLVTELALSTHNGRLEIWDDRIVLAGLTDSLVTATALRIQAEALLLHRDFQNELSVVATEDLPKIDISLAEVPSPTSVSRPAGVPATESPYEPPGLGLEKLLATVRMLGRIDFLAGRAPAPTAPATDPLRAVPLPMTASPVAAPTSASPAVPEIETPKFESLPPLLFSRNSHLPQANQSAVLDEVVKILLSPERQAFPLRVEAVKPDGGSSAFNDYLAERRLSEVQRWLVERGVDGSRITAKAVSSPSPIDGGEVRLSLEIILPDPAVTIGPGEDEPPGTARTAPPVGEKAEAPPSEPEPVQ